MDKVILSENHKRAVTSAMYLVEKLVVELEDELLHHNEKVMMKISNEGKITDEQHYITIINNIKSGICKMADKYNLTPTYSGYNQIINSKKTKIWEILENTKSKKLKGYGEFPKELAQEFDLDIENLLILTEDI